jgi:hypothetical protein
VKVNRTCQGGNGSEKDELPYLPVFSIDSGLDKK